MSLKNYSSSQKGYVVKLIACIRLIKVYFLPDVPEVWKDFSSIAKDSTWTISNERTYMEDLVYKRFTLFLAVVAALLTGAINLHQQRVIMLLLLALGTCLCWMLQQAISRAQRKLDIILKLLFEDHTHPAGYVNLVLDDGGRVGLIGHIVPKAICIILTLGTVIGVVDYEISLA
jgi:hypothetical protein